MLGYATMMPNNSRKIKKIKRKKNNIVVVYSATTTSYPISTPATMLVNNDLNTNSTTIKNDLTDNTAGTTMNTFLELPGT